MQLLLVLHAHLPWVRDRRYPGSIEERWLFEALWESYLPLLEVVDRAAERGQREALALSLSPPLLAMLGDARLMESFRHHLDHLEQLAVGVRASAGGLRAEALDDHLIRLRRSRARLDAARGDLPGAFGEHHRAGVIELFTSAATHALLPACTSRAHVAAQIGVGQHALQAATGVSPAGIWLPECAYDPRLDPLLAQAGVGFTVLDGHGIDLARPRSPLGVFAPVLAPTGFAAFGREPGAARRVWSRRDGFPGDPAYREFHHDLSDELPPEALGPLAPPPGARAPVGLRLCRVTGAAEKQPYDPHAARGRAREHAAVFVREARETLARAPRVPGTPPVLVAPYDAELFGHWWWEGPIFLDAVLEMLAPPSPLETTTPTGRLARAPDLPLCQPATSTWGAGGHLDVWAAAETAPMLRAIHRAERAVDAAFAMIREVGGTPDSDRLRARDLAARELMLGAASDWAFLVRTGTNVDYGKRRAEAHLGSAIAFAQIARRGALGAGERDQLDRAERDGPPLSWVPRAILERAWDTSGPLVLA